MNAEKAFELAKRLRALSKTGLTYSTDEYNIARYTEVQSISYELMSLLSGEPLESISRFYVDTKEYPTPKSDVRAVIFNEKNEILLVQETSDKRWSLPGGWADIGHSPSEVAVSEVAEETGLLVTAERLLAVLDKKCHSHPPELEYVYKFFILCKVTGGSITGAHDITNVAYFAQNELPPLSEQRVLPSQVDLMFEFLYNPGKQTVLD